MVTGDYIWKLLNCYLSSRTLEHAKVLVIAKFTFSKGIYSNQK